MRRKSGNVLSDGEWGQQQGEGGDWTGVVGMVAREEADIGVAHLTITQERMQAVDFLPYTIEQNTFATRLPHLLPKSEAYLGPFRPALWLGLLLTLLLAPPLFRLLAHKSVAFLDLLGSVWGQPIAVARPWRDRLLLGAWLVFALVLSTSYKAVLLSALAVPAYEGGVRDILGLAEAVEEGTFSLFASRGSVDREMLTGSLDPALRVIGRGVVEVDWAGEGGAVAAPRRIADRQAVLGPRFFFRLEYGDAPFAAHFVFPESVSFWYVGVAVRKGFCCKRALERSVQRVMATGIYERFYREELFKARVRFGGREVQHAALSLGDCFGPFFVVAIGLVLATLVLLVEMYLPKHLQCGSNGTCRNKSAPKHNRVVAK